MPQSTRNKISKALKQRWKDPEYRSTVQVAMKGKAAWNKGMALSDETRAKMSRSKMDHTPSKATRKKISLARKGAVMSAELRAQISERMAGQPKSEEHRQRIAASQRRRHAAARVLRAVESAYVQSTTAVAAAAAAQGRPAGGGGAGGVAVPLRAGVLSREARSPKSQRQQILNAFKAELREYRCLKEELLPWTQAFEESHGRKPNVCDVQNTGIVWLIDKFKQYLVLRDRLFSDTSVLRTKLTGAMPDTDAGSSGLSHGPGGAASSTNGAAQAARINAASRLAAASEYKGALQRKQAAAAPGATSGGGQAPEGSERPLPGMGPTAPTRLRKAMAAALEYREMRAKATNATATAAATAAKAGWHDAQLPPTTSSPGAGATGADAALAPRRRACAAVAEEAGLAPPADVVLAQAAAHRALHDVREAELRMHNVLSLQEFTSSEEDEPPGGPPDGGPEAGGAGAQLLAGVP